MPPDEYDWFGALAEARHHELKGWPRVSAILWTANLTDKWWSPQYETEADALAQPEIQLSPSTADQYVKCWHAFRCCPVAELERSRPRLLFQAVKAVVDEEGIVDEQKAAEAVSDAQIMSWSSFKQKWASTKE